MPNYGVLLRVYTPKKDEVEDRVRRAVAHVEQITALRQTCPELAWTTLLVPRDYDCGETARRLREELHNYPAVSVLNPTGHHSEGVLNTGVKEVSLYASHALIVSGKAMNYLTEEVLTNMDEAFFSKGARVSGLALPELANIVRAGRIQNTFAAWHIDSLLFSGGFDSSLGVEEVAPIIRLIHAYGRCVAPIECGDGTLDIHDSDTARARHAEVMRTKIEAQQAECDRLGSSFAFIEAGVIH